MDSIASVRFYWHDREGNEGALQWYVPSSNAFDPIVASAIDTALPVLQALSDATFYRVRVEYRMTLASAPTFSTSSDLTRRLLLFYENESSELDSIALYSPLASVFETVGPYAGLRVLPSAITAITSMLTVLPFVTIDDRPMGTSFVAGALAY